MLLSDLDDGVSGSGGGSGDSGLDDGEILEANQIICYFNYVNRSLNGLGVTTDNDIVGFYTDSDDG